MNAYYGLAIACFVIGCWILFAPDNGGCIAAILFFGAVVFLVLGIVESASSSNPNAPRPTQTSQPKSTRSNAPAPRGPSVKQQLEQPYQDQLKVTSLNHPAGTADFSVISSDNKTLLTCSGKVIGSGANHRLDLNSLSNPCATAVLAAVASPTKG